MGVVCFVIVVVLAVWFFVFPLFLRGIYIYIYIDR